MLEGAGVTSVVQGYPFLFNICAFIPLLARSWGPLAKHDCEVYNVTYTYMDMCLDTMKL